MPRGRLGDSCGFQACLEIHGRYFPSMSTVFEIEDAVQKLSPNELSAFRDWFLGFDALAAAVASQATEDTDEEQKTLKAWLRAAVEQGLNEAQAGELISSADAKSKMAKFKEDWRKSRTVSA